MDSYQALRKDLETFAKELSIKNFQALSPGLGIGALVQKNNSKGSLEEVSIASTPRFVEPSLRTTVPSVVSSSNSSPLRGFSQDDFRDERFRAESIGAQTFGEGALGGVGNTLKSIPIPSRSSPTGEGNRYVQQSSTESSAENSAAQSPVMADRRDKLLGSKAKQRANDRTQFSRGQSDTFIARPMDLGNEAQDDKDSVGRAPWWAWILGHMVDLMVVCLCLAVCAYGVSLMVSDFRSIKFLKIAPALWVGVLYATLIFYTLIFKILGIPLMGSHIRKGFASPKENQSKVPSSI